MTLTSWRMKLVWLVAAAAIVLPLIAMQFTPEVKWTLFDFVVAEALILGFGFSYEYFAARNTRRNQVILGAVMFAAFILLWGFLATKT